MEVTIEKKEKADKTELNIAEGLAGDETGIIKFRVAGGLLLAFNSICITL